METPSTRWVGWCVLLIDSGHLHQEQGGPCAASRVLVYMGDSLTDLKTLTDKWKQELNEGVEVKEEWQPSGNRRELRRKMVRWVKSLCMKTTTGETVCVYCGFICSEQGDFSAHMTSHWFRKKTKNNKKVRNHICPECGQGFYDFIFVKKHALRLHNIEIEDKFWLKECEFCNEMLPIKNINTHRKQFHKNENIKCQECQKTFMTPVKFKVHFKNMHTTDYAGFCDICQKEVQRLSKHRSEKHKDSPCNHCDKVFQNPVTLESHMKSVNGTMKRRQCPECSLYFVNLSDHIRTVHRRELKPYRKNGVKCIKCCKWIPKDQYKSHHDSCTVQTHTCSICHKEVRKLDHHLRMAHSERVKCVLCPELFSATGAEFGKLSNHIFNNHIADIYTDLGIIDDLHTEDIKRREQITQLFVDNKSILKDKKYVCLLCEKSFDTRTWMIYHMQIHLRYQGAKNPRINFPCTDCGKMGSSKELEQHICKIQTKRKSRSKKSQNKSDITDNYNTFQYFESEVQIPNPQSINPNHTKLSKSDLESSKRENYELKPTTHFMFIESFDKIAGKANKHQPDAEPGVPYLEPAHDIFEPYDKPSPENDDPEMNPSNPEPKEQLTDQEVPKTKKQESGGKRSKNCQCPGCITAACGSCPPCLTPRCGPAPTYSTTTNFFFTTTSSPTTSVSSINSSFHTTYSPISISSPISACTQVSQAM